MRYRANGGKFRRLRGRRLDMAVSGGAACHAARPTIVRMLVYPQPSSRATPRLFAAKNRDPTMDYKAFLMALD
jgi:hypothetical protein